MQVTLENKTTIEVNKLPLGKYADLLQALQELPKHFDELKDIKSLSNEAFIALIPKLLGTCLPDFIRIIQIATPLTAEEIENLSLSEVIDVISAIYTVNNYQAVYEKIKKMIPNLTTKTEVPEENVEISISAT